MEQLHCPKCHKPLIYGNDEEFETLTDHVCDPNASHRPLRPTLVCNNVDCIVSKGDNFWDEGGDFYGHSRIDFKDDISSAYPSHARQMDIKIYKKGLKKKTYLHPALMLWVLEPVIEYNYEADNYGTVLKRTWQLKWLKKDCWYKKDRLGYHTYYNFPIPSIIWHLKRNYNILKNTSDEYIVKTVEDVFEPLPSWDKRWWRHVEKILDKIIFLKYYVIYLNKSSNLII